jgi:hypothetical protein
MKAIAASPLMTAAGQYWAIASSRRLIEAGFAPPVPHNGQRWTAGRDLRITWSTPLTLGAQVHRQVD